MRDTLKELIIFTYITRTFILATILLTGLYVLSVQPAQADWDERQQGLYNDGIFIGRVAQCIQYDGREVSRSIFYKWLEALKQWHINEYGIDYVNSKSYQSPITTGISVGGATQKQKYTRECDMIMDQMQQISKYIEFDIKAAYDVYQK